MKSPDRRRCPPSEIPRFPNTLIGLEEGLKLYEVGTVFCRTDRVRGKNCIQSTNNIFGIVKNSPRGSLWVSLDLSLMVSSRSLSNIKPLVKKKKKNRESVGREGPAFSSLKTETYGHRASSVIGMMCLGTPYQAKITFVQGPVILSSSRPGPSHTGRDKLFCQDRLKRDKSHVDNYRSLYLLNPFVFPDLCWSLVRLRVR